MIEASAELREAIRLEDREAAAHYYLGNVLSKQGKRSDAIDEYGIALFFDAFDPNDKFGHGRAVGTQAREKLEEAIAESHKCMRPSKKPKHTFTWRT